MLVTALKMTSHSLVQRSGKPMLRTMSCKRPVHAVLVEPADNSSGQDTASQPADLFGEFDFRLPAQC